MPLEVFINATVIFANLWVGSRLLKRGRAGGELPATLLGAAFVADGVEWLLWTLALYTPAEGTVVADFLAVACRLGIATSAGFIVGFVYAVFRPGRSWALLFGVFLTVTMTIGIVAGIFQGDWMGTRTDTVWIWMESGSPLAVYMWIALEAGAEYRRMKRRLALGLADPVVANRLLLWAAYGGVASVTQSIELSAILVSGETGSYPAFYDNLMVVTTISSVGAIWLAFSPPQAYLRWVAARHTAAPA